MTEADLILTLLLIAGFALLGALITLGNARQARAIRDLEEAWRDWAEADLRLKRERERRELRPPADPDGYLNRIARALAGREAARWERIPEGFRGDGMLLSPLPPEAVSERFPGVRIRALRVDASAFEDPWVAETLSLLLEGEPRPQRWRLYILEPRRMRGALARVWS
ncbi:hypothetical protein [Thermoflexus sp.]|uniref:hypothetical protein n=1 Tax=Thermoflexus sp. TaxID=1969742 RepID=UPI002ADE8BCC|nr:hypothetical protein [Thermoflexus sp.]